MPAPPQPDEIWSVSVDLGARGLYADAAHMLPALLDRGDRWTSLALSTLASHSRQVGDVAGAQDLDAEALRHADDAESRADALIGLAADAVACGDHAAAGAQHDRAEADARPAWRTLTRWHWVGAELALLTGESTTAVEHARAALAACQGCSPRHEAKSRIVLAAVSGDLADLDSVGATLADAGWVTLAWPLALVAADHAGACPPPWLGVAWAAGRRATYLIEGGLPAGLLAAWRTHPGVRRLREGGCPPGGG